MTQKVAASSHSCACRPSPLLRNCGRNAAWKIKVLGLANATAKPREKARWADSGAGVEGLRAFHKVWMPRNSR